MSNWNLDRGHTNDEMLFIIVGFFCQQDFFAVWPHDNSEIIMIVFQKSDDENFHCRNRFPPKTIMVNLAENMCDRNIIMINVPINSILCRRHFLLSELQKTSTLSDDNFLFWNCSSSVIFFSCNCFFPGLNFFCHFFSGSGAPPLPGFLEACWVLMDINSLV